METFSTRQLAAISASNKTVYWTFRVTDINGNTFYWSTGEVPASDNSSSVRNIINAPDAYDNMEWESAHEFKIINFSGISLRRNKSESGIHAPNDLTFTIINKNNEYNYENFLGGTVRVNVIINDGVKSEMCGAWRFRINGAAPYNQLIDISCEDFLQEYLKGSYPNTQLVDELYPSIYGTSQDTLCVPEPYGTCYIPLRSFYANSDRYYLLGPDSYSYSISEVRSPRELGAKIVWLSSGYSFPQSSYQGWRLFQPLIAESGGSMYPGVFMSGSKILDMPTKFSRSDTASVTNPADIIRRVLWNMGVLDYDINIPSFDEAKATYSSWGLAWNFAFFYKEDRTKVLSTLLAMCGSCLIVGERITLKVLSKASQQTITEAEVVKKQEVGMDTFKNSATMQDKASDSGHVAYQIEGESQDEFLKALVPAKTTRDVIDSETIIFAGVQNTEQIQRLGTLYYQRKFLKSGDVSFDAKGTCLALRPDDVITVDYPDYGGTYSILIDDITIKPDIAIQFKCQKFSAPLDDWGDITPGPIVPGDNVPNNPYSVVIAGPDGTTSSGTPPNVLPGRLRIGDGADFILIDPAPPIRVSVYAANVEQLRIGNLNQFIGFSTNIFGLGIGTEVGFRAWFTAVGCYIGDDNRYMKYTVANGLEVRGTISADDIIIGTLDLGALIDAGAIGGWMIGGGTITAYNIEAGAITANEIDANYIYTGVLSAYQVNAVDIDAGSITTGILAAGRIGAGSITAIHIASDYIYTGSLSADQISAVGINAGWINAGILSVDRILARSINGQLIGLEQIGGGAGEGHIVPGTIIGPDIALRSITADRIAAHSITAYEIDVDYVYAGEINADKITTGTLAAARIASNYVYAGYINASQINAGVLNVDRIAANSIVSSKLYAYDPITGGYSEDLLQTLHLNDRSITDVAISVAWAAIVSNLYGNWQTIMTIPFTTYVANTYVFFWVAGEWVDTVNDQQVLYTSVDIDSSQIFANAYSSQNVSEYNSFGYSYGINISTAGTHTIYFKVAKWISGNYLVIPQLTMSVLGVKR